MCFTYIIKETHAHAHTHTHTHTHIHVHTYIFLLNVTQLPLTIYRQTLHVYGHLVLYTNQFLIFPCRLSRICSGIANILCKINFVIIYLFCLFIFIMARNICRSCLSETNHLRRGTVYRGPYSE